VDGEVCRDLEEEDITKEGPAAWGRGEEEEEEKEEAGGKEGGVFPVAALTAANAAAVIEAPISLSAMADESFEDTFKTLVGRK
jgi:hypothetical protein